MSWNEKINLWHCVDIGGRIVVINLFIINLLPFFTPVQRKVLSRERQPQARSYTQSTDADAKNEAAGAK